MATSGNTVRTIPPTAPGILAELYEHNGLLAKIVDMPAEDAADAGFTLAGMSKTGADFFQDALDMMEWEDAAGTAMKWQRLYSGALIVMFANDGGRLEDPLDLGRVRGVDHLQVFDSTEISVDLGRAGEPERFCIHSPIAECIVHPSRCLLFRSDPLPELMNDPITGFWGIPLYPRIEQALRIVTTAHGAPTRILEKTTQPVYRMSGLSSMLSTEDGERVLADRLEALDLGRGLLSTVAIGDGDEYKTLSTPAPLTEAAALVNQSWNMLAAVSGIPRSILAGGTVPDTGDKVRAPMQKGSDEQALISYQDFIRDLQIKQLKKPLLRLLKIIGQAGLISGELEELEPLYIKWKPLFQTPPMQAAENELKAAQAALERAKTIQAYVGMEAIDPEEARRIINEKTERRK